jgi:hypothetical protein
MNFLGLSDNSWIILIILSFVIFFWIKGFMRKRKLQKDINLAQKHGVAFNQVTERIENGTATEEDQMQFKKTALLVTLTTSTLIFRMMMRENPNMVNDSKECRELVSAVTDLVATWIVMQEPEPTNGSIRPYLVTIIQELRDEGLLLDEFIRLLLTNNWEKALDILNATYMHGKWSTRLTDLVNQASAKKPTTK